MIQDMKILEEQVHKLMDLVSQLKEDRTRLQARLENGEAEIQSLRKEVASFREIQKDHEQFQQERSEVRSRIEKMLNDLKGVEGVRGVGQRE